MFVTNRIILPCLALLVLVGMLVSIPFRRKKLLATAGELKFTLPEEFPLKPIVIFVVCAALLCVIPFRNFAFYLQFVFAAVALIACEMSARSISSYKLCGMYENMVVYDTYSVLLDDIGCLPTVNYEDDPETVGVDKRFLEILRQNGSQVILGFETEELRQKVLAEILKKRPELKV